MTAIMGLFGITSPDAASHIRTALRAMHVMGSEQFEVWQEPSERAALGAVSDIWQVEGRSADHARLAFDERAVVVTDASLYYTTDLERELRSAGDTQVARSPAGLILAAYRAWGRDALQHLEGDFALLVWDRRESHALAARDHAGARTLFFGPYGDGLAVASRLEGLVALPGFDSALDLMSLANDALFLRVNAPEATAYRNAKRIPAGHRLEWRGGGAPKVDRWWDVPIFVRGDGPPFPEAVEELRRLIIGSVIERTKHSGGSAVWLSGGYDSPTLFAASHEGARTNGVTPAKAVSIKYPPDDPGYEDNFISATTGFWHEEPAWVDAAGIPAIERPLERALWRDEPMPHAYELWNAALTRATRAQERRIALIGNGGDQFFSASTARLADHLRAGRLITLAREWNEAGGGRNWRRFARDVVAANWPTPVRAVANFLRHGRTLQHRLERPVAPWANKSFEHIGPLIELNRTQLDRRPGESHASVDQSWTLRHVAAERVASLLTEIGMSEGVEVRSPLFDSRVVRFAAGRPLAESYSRRENKRLLRAAFRGLLPELVLARRTHRTGLPVRYLKRTVAAHAAWAVSTWPEGMILADLYVIDGRKFLDRAAQIPDRGISDLEEGVALVAAVQTECWLRSRKATTVW